MYLFGHEKGKKKMTGKEKLISYSFSGNRKESSNWESQVEV